MQRLVSDNMTNLAIIYLRRKRSVMILDSLLAVIESASPPCQWSCPAQLPPDSNFADILVISYLFVTHALL